MVFFDGFNKLILFQSTKFEIWVMILRMIFNNLLLVKMEGRLSLKAFFVVLTFHLLIQGSSATDLHKFDGVLQRYFAASKPSSYYVSIEPKQDGLSKIVNNQIFHGWFGLRVSPNYEDFALEKITSVQIQHAAFVISNQSQQIFKLGSGKNEQAITITLVDLCKKYFLARPTFLAIEDGDLTMNAVDSPFWEDAECAPEVLLLRDSSEVQKYFAAKKWERKQTIDGFALYLHPSFAAAYSSASTAGTEGRTAAGSDRQALSEVLRLIRKAHPFEAGKSDEELLSVFDINTKYVSIPDIVERAFFTRRSKYLLLRGYSADANEIFLGRSPQAYKLASQKLKDSTLQNITLLGNSPFSYILIPHHPSQSPKIFEQVLSSMKCKKYHIDETLYIVPKSLNPEKKSAPQVIKEIHYKQQVSADSFTRGEVFIIIFIVIISFAVLFFFLANKLVAQIQQPRTVQRGQRVYEQADSAQGVDLKSVHRLEQKGQPQS